MDGVKFNFYKYYNEVLIEDSIEALDDFASRSLIYIYVELDARFLNRPQNASNRLLFTRARLLISGCALANLANAVLQIFLRSLYCLDLYIRMLATGDVAHIRALPCIARWHFTQLFIQLPYFELAHTIKLFIGGLRDPHATLVKLSNDLNQREQRHRARCGEKQYEVKHRNWLKNSKAHSHSEFERPLKNVLLLLASIGAAYWTIAKMRHFRQNAYT